MAEISSLRKGSSPLPTIYMTSAQTDCLCHVPVELNVETKPDSANKKEPLHVNLIHTKAHNITDFFRKAETLAGQIFAEIAVLENAFGILPCSDKICSCSLPFVYTSAFFNFSMLTSMR